MFVRSCRAARPPASHLAPRRAPRASQLPAPVLRHRARLRQPIRAAWLAKEQAAAAAGARAPALTVRRRGVDCAPQPQL
eukprot:7418725-Pyramimonas_sp.AAC.1